MKTREGLGLRTVWDTGIQVRGSGCRLWDMESLF